jgi:hypothetical protein
MTFLPIVERELRVAARRRGPFRTRLLAAGVGTLVAAGILALMRSSAGFGGSAPGFTLFQALGWLGFLFAAAAGMFLTSDCLSEERREGTLGLLFLTDLHGYDVVLGKLAATSLCAVYGLLAVAPVFALAFLLGGVTGHQFTRLAFALGNSLLFSLSVGMTVSAHSRDAQKAMNGTLLVCLLFTAGIPLLDGSLAGWTGRGLWPWLRSASSFHAFSEAGVGGPGYWASLLEVLALSGGFLALSSRRVRSRFEAAPMTVGRRGGMRRAGWRRASNEKSARARRRWLEVNPILWLGGREAGMGLVVAIVAGLSVVALGLLVSGAWDLLGAGAGLLGVLQALLWLVTTFWVVAHASRFFIDGRRTGLLELVLTTPLSVPEILRGHWGALWRTFRSPVLGLLVMQGVLGVAQWAQSRGSARGVGSGGFPVDFASYQAVSIAAGLVLSITGLLALTWFGMWMGLTSRKLPVAVVKTLAFVWLIPSFALAFIQGLGMFAFSLARWPLWLAAVIPALLKAGVDVGFILYARARLRTRFRLVVTEPDRAGRMIRPPPIMSPLTNPPAAMPADPSPASAVADRRSPAAGRPPPPA